jgi:hypothetical protein
MGLPSTSATASTSAATTSTTATAHASATPDEPLEVMASISPVDSIGSRIRGFVAAGESKKINIFSSAYLTYMVQSFKCSIASYFCGFYEVHAILLFNLARFDLLHIFPN